MCAHTYTNIYISEKISDCLIYSILSNGELIKYQIFFSVVVIELSVRCLITGPGDSVLHRQYNTSVQLTLHALMTFSFLFDSTNVGWPIVYFEGPKVSKFQIIIVFLFSE